MMKLQLTESTFPFKTQLEYMDTLGLINLDDGGVPLYTEKSDGFSVGINEDKAFINYAHISDIFCGAFILSQKEKGYDESHSLDFLQKS